MNGFLGLHKKPSPIELSILCYTDLIPWRHPTPYEFHFSEYWRPKFEVIASENDLAFWDFKEVYTDGDIACHVNLINQNGICIYGRAIRETFPLVPEKDLASWCVGYRISTLTVPWLYSTNGQIGSRNDRQEIDRIMRRVCGISFLWVTTLKSDRNSRFSPIASVIEKRSLINEKMVRFVGNMYQ